MELRDHYATYEAPGPHEPTGKGSGRLADLLVVAVNEMALRSPLSRKALGQARCRIL